MFTLLREFVLYGVVVSVGLALDVGLLYALTEYAELWYFLSAGISFFFALILNYLLAIHFVFKSRSLTQQHHEFILFACIGGSALGVNQLIMYIGVEKWGLYFLHAKLIAIPITFMWNFAWNKFLLFKSK